MEKERRIIMIDYALYFFGVPASVGNQYVRIPLWSNKTAGFSLTFWMRRVDPQRKDYRDASIEPIIQNGVYEPPPRNGWGLYYGFGGSNLHQFFLEKMSTSIAYAVSYNDVIDLWSWTHIALVVIDAGSTCTTRFYVNGILHRERTGIPKVTTPDIPYTYIAQQKEYDGSVNIEHLYRTWLREMRFWDRELSGPEILADKDASNPDTNQLKVWYPMNEGSGTTLTDNSGNSNDGTILGVSPTWEELSTLPDYIFDDSGLIFWTAVYGTASDNETDRKHGLESYKIILSNQLLDIYRDIPLTGPYPSDGRNFSGKSNITFWFYGVNSNRTIRLTFGKEPRASLSNYFYHDFPDNFSGWQQFNIVKSTFSQFGNPLNWTQIKYISFQSDGNITGTIKVDQIMLFDTEILQGINELLSLHPWIDWSMFKKIPQESLHTEEIFYKLLKKDSLSRDFKINRYKNTFTSFQILHKRNKESLDIDNI